MQLSFDNPINVGQDFRYRSLNEPVEIGANLSANIHNIEIEARVIIIHPEASLIGNVIKLIATERVIFLGQVFCRRLHVAAPIREINEDRIDPNPALRQAVVLIEEGPDNE